MRGSSTQILQRQIYHRRRVRQPCVRQLWKRQLCIQQFFYESKRLGQAAARYADRRRGLDVLQNIPARHHDHRKRDDTDAGSPHARAVERFFSDGADAIREDGGADEFGGGTDGYGEDQV